MDDSKRVDVETVIHNLLLIVEKEESKKLLTDHLATLNEEPHE